MKSSTPIYLWAVMFNDYEGTYLVSIWTMESDARATMEKLSAANIPMRNGKRQEFPGYEVERIKLNTDTYDEDNYE